MEQTLQIALEEKKTSIAEIARKCEQPYMRIYRILTGKTGASPQILKLIYQRTGIDANSWAGIKPIRGSKMTSALTSQ